MKNSYKISLALVAALLVGVQTSHAQYGLHALMDSIAFTDVTDTVTINDTFYMFNPVKEGGYFFENEQGTWVGWDTATKNFTGYDFPIPFGMGAAYNPIGRRKTMQRYHADDTVAVYGIAVTMGPSVWSTPEVDRPGMDMESITKMSAPPDSLYPLTKEWTGFKVDLYDSSYTLLDSAWLDTSLTTIKYAFFRYEPEKPEKDTDYVPCWEFYFDRPTSLSGNFWIEVDWSASQEMYKNWKGNIGAVLWGVARYCALYQYWNLGDTNRLNHDDFFRVNDTNGIIKDRTFWGVMFPIVGLRCNELKHVELTEQGEHYARVGWSADYEAGTAYQVELVDTSRQGNGIILQDEVMDSSYMFVNLYAGHSYTARVRKQCHYQTAHYDTITWGHWRSIDFEMESDPIDTTTTDTTVVDTTIVDTTGIHLAMVGDADFSLRPNPAVAAAVVTLQYAVAEVAELQLVDLHGRTVQHHVLPAGTKRLTLDLAGLPAGAYLAKLVTPRGLSARRLIVRR